MRVLLFELEEGVGHVRRRVVGATANYNIKIWIGLHRIEKGLWAHLRNNVRGVVDGGLGEGRDTRTAAGYAVGVEALCNDGLVDVGEYRNGFEAVAP